MQTKIKKLIQKYSEVYREFEEIQKTFFLASGDQKTGVIGEYYARCYAQNLPNVVSVDYANAGSSYDLICKSTDNPGEFKIQVKCVSEHSKTKTIAPINLKNDAFDELYLIYLDKEFKPSGFYINSYQEIKGKFEPKNPNKFRITGAKMSTGPIKKSAYLDFSNNLVNQLQKSLQ